MPRHLALLQTCSRKSAGLQGSCRAIRHTHRAFSTSDRRSLNPLLNLSGLSFSKEAQYFSKERKIPREEFSSNLELIRSSEVDPFAPAPGTSPTVIAALRRAQRGESDMQTAFSLAMSNLLLQLEASKAETKQVAANFRRLQEKHQQQERHALILVLGIVAFVSVTFLKPNLFDSIGHDIHELQRRWKQFDWQWLGNPPKYRLVTADGQPVQVATVSDQTSPHDIPSDIVNTNDDVVLGRTLEHVVERTSTTTSLLSRLFWASSGNR